MRKFTSLLALLFIVSCGIKQTRSMLNDGDYDGAIHQAVSGLSGNKDKKGNQEYVLMLEEAFAKAKERDLREIELLAKDANPRNLEKIFTTYQQLNSRQNLIRPLLPLKVLAQNRTVNFAFDDYSDQIVNSKNALSKYLYTNVKGLMGTKDKMNYRRAYDDLAYLDQISPDFKDVRNLMDEAKTKGSDYVTVYSKNETNQIIPARLENDLLDFSTYGLNDKWTVYHNSKLKGIAYDFAVVLNFRQINLSPEQIKEKQFVKERKINLGKKKLLDRRGNPVRDSLNRIIMVDNIRNVKATITEFRQFKAAQVTAKVDYIDIKTNQLIDTYPLSSEFVFENIYARYKGDRRAADNDYAPYFDNRPVPFPSNEQMVYDTGEDLKAKLKGIITKYKIRK